MDILLSALQHYAFCPRQCALIYIEQVWQENADTALGRLLHENVHSEGVRIRDGVRVVTDLELRCARLGLYGRADVVEFHRQGAVWCPYPVEYKKGHPRKKADVDKIQLCAQALCLEEMLGLNISEGAIFYGQTRRRCVVPLDAGLRDRTEEIVQAVKRLLESGVTPEATVFPGCSDCSLKDWCMPDLSGKSASGYVKSLCGG